MSEWVNELTGEIYKYDDENKIRHMFDDPGWQKIIKELAAQEEEKRIIERGW